MRDKRLTRCACGIYLGTSTGISWAQAHLRFHWPLMSKTCGVSDRVAIAVSGRLSSSTGVMRINDDTGSIAVGAEA